MRLAFALGAFALTHGLAPRARAEQPAYRDAVQADLGLAVVGLAYERAFTRRFAVQLEAHMFGTWFGPQFDRPNVRGPGVQLRPTFFLTHDAPRGVYLAPFVRTARVSTEVGGETVYAGGSSVGLFAGYGFVLADRFNVRVGAGAQYMRYVLRNGAAVERFDQPFPALDLVIGYALGRAAPR